MDEVGGRRTERAVLRWIYMDGIKYVVGRSNVETEGIRWSKME
jgi:hypothetical protein